MTSIAFIGGGNMASCLIGGMINNGFNRQQIIVSEPGKEAREKIGGQYGISTTESNRAAVAESDLIVLAVKPQVMRDVATDLAPALKHKPLVISIAAGIPASALQHWMGKDLAVVRAMPNTPAMKLTGATGLFANPQVNQHQKALAEKIFQAVGVADWVASEQLIDAVTAVSGSGPAYFFLFMEIMQRIGEELGLSERVAQEFTLQTALGAARMAIESDNSPGELRAQVTSPGGTTERAISNFQQAGLEDIFRQAMQDAMNRAREMSDDFSD